MKKRLILAIFGCMPLVATAGIMGQNIGLADASTVLMMVLGSVALLMARRLQKN